jgi:DNA-directed RNA polymerase specialized sigma24 family protein
MLDFNPLLKQESETHFSVRYDARGHRRFYRKTQEGRWVLVPKDVFCMLRASVRQEENALISEASHDILSLTELESGTTVLDHPDSVWLSDIEESPESLLIGKEERARLAEQVRRVVESFPVQDQDLIWATIADNTSSADYASRIGVHRDTVSRRKRQLMKLLQKELLSVYESYKRGTL